VSPFPCCSARRDGRPLGSFRGRVARRGRHAPPSHTHTHARARPAPPLPRAALHEDAERLERLVVKDYRQEDVKGHRDRLMQNHRVRSRLDRMQEAAGRLLRAYKDGEDECEARREEIAALGAVDQTRAFA
jgi:hypothetical protein